MKRKTIYLCMLAMLMMLPSCNNEEVSAPPMENETSVLAGRIFTRAGETPNNEEQKVCLYVAERRKEDVQNELCCQNLYNIENGTYQLSGMLGQWYKLAFVCVPTEVQFPEISAAGEAFNDLLIDYTPILEQNEHGIQHETEDLAIYRKVIDRWLIPEEEQKEDVMMTRITGQLVLNMGILEDQFPNTVQQIKVTLNNVPYRVYLRDNSNEEIFYPEAITQAEDGEVNVPLENITYESKSFSYTYDSGDIVWGKNEACCMYFNLLPCTLSNSTVEVTYLKDNNENDADTETVSYNLITSIALSVEIKPNVKTTVYFNGMENGEFEVRYAGFEDTSIDVDTDWNGWN